MRKGMGMRSQRSLSRWCVWGLAIFGLLLGGPRARGQNQPAPQRTPPALGTIKSITGNQLVLATDSGSEVKVQLPPDVKVLQVPPGSKDLKEAEAIQLSNLQAGDRVLVQTKPGEDPSTLVALRVIAMKKSDIAEKQAKDREADAEDYRRTVDARCRAAHWCGGHHR